MAAKKPIKSSESKVATKSAAKPRAKKAVDTVSAPVASVENALAQADVTIQPVVEVRHTPVPPKSAKAAKATADASAPSNAMDVAPSHQQVSDAAYFLWQSGSPGSAFDHWVSAEASLRGKI